MLFIHIVGLSSFVAVPSWEPEFESSRLLFVPTPPVFAYYSGFKFQTARRDFMFRVAISECCVLTIIAFLLSAIIAAQPGLRKAFTGVLRLINEASLFPISFLFRECFDAVGFLKIICQCSFEISLAVLA